MKKLMTMIFAFALLASVGLMAQDTTTPQDNTMKSGASMKASSMMGKISEDGKSFVSDKDGKSYTIDNPDAVKGHEGHHVNLKAQLSADKSSVNVKSLKMAGGNDSMNK